MGKIAFLFAGQGSQYAGMGRSLAECSAAAAGVFALADSLRPGTSGECFHKSKAELSETRVTQPAMFCVDLAAAAVLRERGVRPDFAAGFSLGEIPALAFCGYLSPADAFRFVVRRGEEMALCAEGKPGEMYAVLGLPAEAVEGLAAGFPGVWPVNYNAPGQTVVSCAAGMGLELAEAVKAAGGRALRLAVSGAFHSPLMEDAARRLGAEFSALRFLPPEIPCFSNVTAEPYAGEALLFSQISSPVRWQSTIETLCAMGVTSFVECGPGKVLAGLVKKISPASTAVGVEDEETLNRALEVLEHA